MEKIGNLIPKQKVTLLHGRSGCGKTTSILKYLTGNKVEPMLIDFDHNDEFSDNNDSVLHVDGYKLLAGLEEEATSKGILIDLRGRVLVIDTYALAEIALAESKLAMSVGELAGLFTGTNCTVIVVAHTTYFSGKPAEPMVDTIFSNHVACRLHLHNEVKKKITSIYLEVEKLRGMSSCLIHDWMR